MHLRAAVNSTITNDGNDAHYYASLWLDTTKQEHYYATAASCNH